MLVGYLYVAKCSREVKAYISPVHPLMEYATGSGLIPSYLYEQSWKNPNHTLPIDGPGGSEKLYVIDILKFIYHHAAPILM